jgi:hypothetical protein
MIKKLNFLKIMSHLRITTGYFIVKAREEKNVY